MEFLVYLGYIFHGLKDLSRLFLIYFNPKKYILSNSNPFSFVPGLDSTPFNPIEFPIL